MAIKFTDEQIDILYKNGFTDEDIQYTIDEDRKNGLKDEDIQANILKAVNIDSSVTPQNDKKRGVDLTPSGLVKGGLASVLAPIRGAIHNEDYKTARENALKATEQFKPAGGLGDFAVDLYGYSQLPVLRGGGAARFLGNAAIQGGIPGAVESLKRDGNVVGGAGLGTGIAAALQGITPQAGKVINKVLKSNFVNKNLPKVLEGLTSVPAEYSERALQKEFENKSILSGKFDKKTAYRPIEEKITNARNNLKTQDANIANQYKLLGQEVRNKLNAETMPESWYDEQYKNIGFDINKKLQDAIKPDTYFDKGYNELGEKALNSIENYKNIAGGELDAVLEKMANETQDIGGLRNAVEGVISKMAKGGEFNPAELKASKDLAPIRELLSGIETKPINLHNAKELLYDTANYETTSGIKNNVLKGVANQINNFLRKNPEYAAANDKYANILDLVKGIGGDNARTIATKLRDYGSGASIRSGADAAMRGIDEVLPFNKRFLNDLEKLQGEQAAQNFLKENIKQGTLNNITKYDTLPYNQQEMLNMLAPDEIAKYKNLSLQQGQEAFLRNSLPETILNDISKYDKAPLEVQSALEQFAPQQLANYQNLAKEQGSIKDILKTISERYENSPRPLSDKNSIKFENALSNLENKSGINFVDNLKDIRAAEALNELFPGQGGGSGTSQGFGNLLRTSIIGGSPAYALLGHNPFAWAGLLSVSPKFTAKGTIKNIGKLSNAAKKATSGAYDEVLRKLSNLGGKAAANMLYGGVEYNDYR